ncbi:type II secretion system protein [Alishewanella longhuensis]
MQTNVQTNKAARGFTLIEILVAMTILFLVVTTGFMAFQSALAAAQRSAQLNYLLTAVPYIQQQIKMQLQANPQQQGGEGMQLNVAYSWQSEAGPLTSAPNDPVLIQFGHTEHKPRFQLHQVSITLTYHQQQRQFSYQELTWLPLQ